MEAEDLYKGILAVVILLAGCAFVGSQGTICIAMPAEWFTGLVSGLVMVLCIYFHQRE